jgi:ribosomal protein L13
MKVFDYSKNKERQRRVVHPMRIKTKEDFETIKRSVKKDDIVLLERKYFSKSISATLYDGYNDDFDYVIITNAAKVVYSGDQENKKIYYHHSMFPGGLKARSIGKMKREYPVELVEKAVQGMLPHNKLGDRMRTHLYVYEGAEHPHTTQKPIELK